MRIVSTSRIIKTGVLPQGCDILEGIKCGAEFVGVGAACATVDTGVGAIACVAAAVGFVADCRECITGLEKDAICAGVSAARGLGVSIPSSLRAFCS